MSLESTDRSGASNEPAMFNEGAVEEIGSNAHLIFESVMKGLRGDCCAQFTFRPRDLNLLSRLLEQLPRIPEGDTVELEIVLRRESEDTSGSSWVSLTLGPERFAIKGGSAEDMGVGTDSYPGPRGEVDDGGWYNIDGDLYDLVSDCEELLCFEETTVTISVLDEGRESQTAGVSSTPSERSDAPAGLLDDALGEIGKILGLQAASPTPGNYFEEVPDEVFVPLANAALELFHAGVDNPEKLAAKLAERGWQRFTGAIWGAMISKIPVLSQQAPNWEEIYAERDRQAQHDRSLSPISVDNGFAMKIREENAALEREGLHADQKMAREVRQLIQAEGPELAKELREQGILAEYSNVLSSRMYQRARDLKGQMSMSEALQETRKDLVASLQSYDEDTGIKDHE